MEHLVVSQVGAHGYLAIFLLMLLESACIPVPSEAVMLFGGALAAGVSVAGVHVHLSVVAVALAGVAGNLAGAWIAYAVGRRGGRPLVERYGRYLLLRTHDLDRAEAYFARCGEITVLVSRVLPVVRTFISVPAGMSRMRFARFTLFTLVGSLPWTFGFAIAGDALANNWSAVSSAFTPISVVVAMLLVAAICVWVVKRRRRPEPEAPAAADDETQPLPVVTPGHARHRAAARPAAAGGGGMLRVPAVDGGFWTLKALSTAMGEATSDYLVRVLHPVPAVLLGFVCFVAALAVQLRRRRYVAWSYWTAVVMVGVFGTMAADVLHVGLGVPYVASSLLYAIVLAAVFVSWRRVEGTLSIHAIDSTRRECFYWAAVVATFAMGTAVGDLTAYSLHLGYFTSAVLFAALIAVPAVGYRLGWGAVGCFWTAYVLTRPLGASCADWMGKPKDVSGLGWGDGAVALVLTLAIACGVGFLSATGRGRQDEPASAAGPVPAERVGAERL